MDEQTRKFDQCEYDDSSGAYGGFYDVPDADGTIEKIDFMGEVVDSRSPGEEDYKLWLNWVTNKE